MVLKGIKFEEELINSRFDRIKGVISLIINDKIEHKIISDFTLTNKQVYDIFKTRFEIQKFVNKDEIIIGYEDLLSRIDKIPDNVMLRVIAVKTIETFIQFFINNESEELLGILWRSYKV